MNVSDSVPIEHWLTSLSVWYYFYYYHLLPYLFTRTYLLTYLLTAIEFSFGGSSPYTGTDKTSKNKYT